MDIRIEHHGSTVLLQPQNSRAADWLTATAPEDAQFFGYALAVEPRYVDGVVEAATEAGLEVA